MTVFRLSAPAVLTGTSGSRPGLWMSSLRLVQDISRAELPGSVMMVRSLGSSTIQPRLSSDDVLYWRADVF